MGVGGGVGDVEKAAHAAEPPLPSKKHFPGLLAALKEIILSSLFIVYFIPSVDMYLLV